jgi:7-cyano-7-deazaguanine synthase
MNKSCLVLLSGGQDSATCLAWAHEQFEEIHTISFDYGQRHRTEIECSANLSQIAGCESHTLVPISSLSYLGNSALLNKEDDIGQHHSLSDNLPASFVPGRNILFLTLAGAKACQLDIKDLVAGVCQTDYSGYPDCRDLTIKSVSISLSLGMDRQFTIHTPLMWKTKAETVLMMNDLGKLDWYGFTHTCYENKKPPCGKCPACKLRIKGFAEAGITDPLMI